MAVYTVKEYAAMIKPFVSVRGYRTFLRAANYDNMILLAIDVYSDSVARGGGAAYVPS